MIMKLFTPRESTVMVECDHCIGDTELHIKVTPESIDATRIFKVPVDKVTKEMKNVVKNPPAWERYGINRC